MQKGQVFVMEKGLIIHHFQMKPGDTLHVTAAIFKTKF
jgi:hypothetical protein